MDRPAELSKEDDEYEAFRKRMMLAYRFRPNPLVRASLTPHRMSALPPGMFWREDLWFSINTPLIFFGLPQNNPRRPYY